MPLDDLHQHPFDHIRMPSEPSLEGLRDWILKVSTYLDITPTELARAAEVAPSTINKFIADTTQTKGMTAKTLQKLIKAASKINSDKFSEAYAGRRTEEQLSDPTGYSVVNVRVGSALRAGSYKTSHLWPVRSQFFVSILLPNALHTGGGREESLKPHGLLGMVVADQHAEGTFPHGTVVICSRLFNHLEIGDYVVISRRDDTGNTELTIRNFVVSPKGDMWLSSRAEPVANRPPDIYAGRAPFEVKYTRHEKFTLSPPPEYVIEYIIISAIQPYNERFEELKFPD
ncbi:hypothetical protein CK489_15300 [Bradyrhizobium sp. UFLA03-84]|uniref:hypothetical protein n=1 Tax=Bradyrhizobium sp. UFLA03-84 TaxID=418599 RepID=UPI000BD162F1|nr:hypothetical protein [Bradyrhizobium sp. UFLA03-84]PAY07165.1 hypothetical protein CK489_15300 [Bradyrhizobium sp. UFLA03-84]